MSATRYRLSSPATTLLEHDKTCGRTAIGRYIMDHQHGEIIIFECQWCGFLSAPYVLDIPGKEKA